MERDRNGVAKRRLKIRRKYPEESADTFESVGKGDSLKATSPYCKSVNITKHTNNGFSVVQDSNPCKKNLSKKHFLVIIPCGRNGN